MANEFHFVVMSDVAIFETLPSSPSAESNSFDVPIGVNIKKKHTHTHTHTKKQPTNGKNGMNSLVVFQRDKTRLLLMKYLRYDKQVLFLDRCSRVPFIARAHKLIISRVIESDYCTLCMKQSNLNFIFIIWCQMYEIFLTSVYDQNNNYEAA